VDLERGGRARELERAARQPAQELEMPSSTNLSSATLPVKKDCAEKRPLNLRNLALPPK